MMKNEINHAIMETTGIPATAPATATVAADWCSPPFKKIWQIPAAAIAKPIRHQAKVILWSGVSMSAADHVFHTKSK